MLLRCLGKAATEALSQPTGGWHRQVSPALALKTDLGGQAGWGAPPTHPTLKATGKVTLTQDVGGHPQQRVEHVVHLPVPLDHVRQLLIVHESGGRSGVWGDPLTTVSLP